ncbi:unnamed protein product, partial [Prorocentrum cordatum]
MLTSASGPSCAAESSTSPAGRATSSAELYYLHYLRSCAASASGAASTSSAAGGASPGPRAVNLNHRGPGYLDKFFFGAFVATRFTSGVMLRGLFQALRPEALATVMLTATGRAIAGGSMPMMSLLAVASGSPVPVMAVSAVRMGGDLRACNPGLANPLYYHPGCVEGGLGPYDQVQGTGALSPEQQNAARGLCDRPGQPTRAEYVADHGRAKRARTDPDTARQAALLGVPLLEKDDGALGPEPEGPSSSMPPQPANLERWDSIDYAALEQDVPTILQAPTNVSAALAQLRGH